ncbi:MAG: DUF370 domain-containing protein [Ruminococcaceae bacterium]|nr:DUF370 domain-containing protein [Oscillospiraceae bacterium]
MRMISIGFGNLVSAERIVSVITPDSAPLKRLVQDAKDSGRAVDATCGRKTRAVIITDSEHVILSALSAETVVERIEGTSSKPTSEVQA